VTPPRVRWYESAALIAFVWLAAAVVWAFVWHR
jgi:hypothetical protein